MRKVVLKMKKSLAVVRETDQVPILNDVMLNTSEYTFFVNSVTFNKIFKMAEAGETEELFKLFTKQGKGVYLTNVCYDIEEVERVAHEEKIEIANTPKVKVKSDFKPEDVFGAFEKIDTDRDMTTYRYTPDKRKIVQVHKNGMVRFSVFKEEFYRGLKQASLDWLIETHIKGLTAENMIHFRMAIDFINMELFAKKETDERDIPNTDD